MPELVMAAIILGLVGVIVLNVTREVLAHRRWVEQMDAQRPLEDELRRLLGGRDDG